MQGSIPNSFKQDLLNRIDIIEVIEERIALKKAGANYVACCPFHQEKTPSFSVNQAKQFYHCFGCNKSGNVITFLMEFDHLSYLEAIAELAAKANLTLPHKHTSILPKNDYKNLYALLEKITHYYQSQLQVSSKAQSYLKQRGILSSTVEQYSIGYAPSNWDNLINFLRPTPSVLQHLQQTGMILPNSKGGYYDRFRDRIMFPIHSRQGQIIGFGGRVLGEGTPKYLNSPETLLFHKGRELYGLYQAAKSNSTLSNLIVVEGYMDVVALAEYKITNVVATLGTATTSFHLEKLFRYTPSLTFCFDGDKAGKEAAWRALQTLLSIITEKHQVQFLFLPEGEDPDSLIRKEGTEGFKKLLQQALSFSQFFFKRLQQEANLENLDGKAKFAQLAKSYIEKMPTSMLSQLMLNELAKMTRLDTQLLQDKNPASSSKILSSQKRLSPIRLAIALLLHHPEVGKDIKHIEDELVSSTLPGIDLFVSLVKFIQHHPHVTTATLLEQWRNSDQEKHLHKLLHWNPMLSKEDIIKEFKGAYKHLYQQVLEQKINEFMQKAEKNELSIDEKKMLQDLIIKTKS